MWIESAVFAVVGVVVGTSGYMGKKVLDIDRRQAAHEASDLATFRAFSESLKETKEGVAAGNEKLDKLITHMLDNPTPSRRKR